MFSRCHLICLILAGLPATAAADDAAFFRDYIEPLLQNNCYECHSHDSGAASGGLVLDSKAGWFVGGDSGPAIVPAEVDKSLLWKVVNHKLPGLEMPPDGMLPEADLGLIQKWIESGAVDPREDGRAAERKTIDIGAGRQWWAFKPLHSPRPSSSKIDDHIEAKLHDAGLRPARRAGSATLLRRVSYDLTGLPPEPGTLSRFDLSNQDQYSQKSSYNFFRILYKMPTIQKPL